MTQHTEPSLREMVIIHAIPCILISASLLIVYFLLQKNEVITFMIFMILIPVFAVFKYDGRIPFVYAVVLLIFVAILTYINKQNIADQIAIFSYWLLVVGTFCLLIEFFRKNR
jgi:integral membrane sensor domain MASE1